MSLSLDSLVSTKHQAPPRIVLHGVEGVGKSTFGACMPNPVFIQTEDGLSGIEANAFPLAKTFVEVMQALTVLIEDEHNFETVCVDSLDWLERLIWDYVCEVEGKKSIEEIGYGKGYIIAVNYWREFLDLLDRLRNEKKMSVCLLCHTMVKNFKSPEVEPYDRYELALHKTSNAIVREWCDVLGFANWRVHTTATDQGFNKKAVRGVTTGERLLHLVEKPAWQAKNRFNLPETVALDYNQFIAAFNQ